MASRHPSWRGKTRQVAWYPWPLVVFLFLSACAPQRAAESLEVLQAIAAGPDATATKEIERRAYAYTLRGRAYTADLYLPEDPPLAALVLVPGAVEAGKDDRRFVAFARALATGRFAVLVPEVANLRRLRVAPSDVTAIADAIEHLASRTEAPAVGLVAISYMGGPAVIAASQARTRKLLRFVTTIGGYYDIRAALTFFTTGHFREPGETRWRHAPPNPYGKWLFLRSNLERLEAPGDRFALERVATAKLRDPAADVGALTGGLTAEGRAVLDLLDNDDPERTASLIARLPAAILEDMRRLDPSQAGLDDLDAKLFAIHGRDDPVIPYSESMALSAELGAERADLVLVERLAHVDVEAPGLGDLLTLWGTVYDILTLRDDMPAPRPDAF